MTTELGLHQESLGQHVLAPHDSGARAVSGEPGTACTGSA